MPPAFTQLPPLLAGQTCLRRLLFPVWSHVDALAAAFHRALGVSPFYSRMRSLAVEGGAFSENAWANCSRLVPNPAR
jgi:hypothetical protein